MNKAVSFIDNAIKVTIALGGILAIAFIYVRVHVNEVNERNDKICKQLCNGMEVYKCVADLGKWDPPVQEAWCVEVNHRPLNK